MDTDSRASSQQHTVHPGHMLTLALPEGSTLFCLGAPIQLSTTPLSTLEHCTGYHMQLHNGQAWRTPCALWVQVYCIEESSRIQVQENLAAPKENRPRLALLGRWMHHLQSGKLKGLLNRGSAV